MWPELGVGFDPQVEHTDELRALAAETGAYILIGYGVDAEAGWRNEAVMLTPAGEFLDAYGKNYPAGEPHIVTSGRYLVYDTPLGRLAPIICNDVNYTAAVRIPARMGAQLVMVPTRMFAGVWKEMQVMAVFRAVENRVSTVIVDGAFRTTMVDPYGRIVADQVTPEGGPLTLVADVPLGNPNASVHPAGRLGRVVGPGGVDRVDGGSVGEREAGEEGRGDGRARRDEVRGFEGKGEDPEERGFAEKSPRRYAEGHGARRPQRLWRAADRGDFEAGVSGRRSVAPEFGWAFGTPLPLAQDGKRVRMYSAALSGGRRSVLAHFLTKKSPPGLAPFPST